MKSKSDTFLLNKQDEMSIVSTTHTVSDPLLFLTHSSASIERDITP